MSRAPTPDMLVRWEVFRSMMRKRRISLNLTQGELSARMDRSQDFVSYLENNARSMPEMATVVAWADALGGTLGVDWDD